MKNGSSAMYFLFSIYNLIIICNNIVNNNNMILYRNVISIPISHLAIGIYFSNISMPPT